MSKEVGFKLTDAAESEVDRLKRRHSILSDAKLFERMLTIFRIVSDALEDGCEVSISGGNRSGVEVIHIDNVVR